MEKLYNEEGQVGVAVSYGYGAGWSTWSEVSPLDGRYNKLILAKEWEEALALAEEEGYYTGGLTDCVIEWIDVGTNFEISDYDGSESMMTNSCLTHMA